MIAKDQPAKSKKAVRGASHALYASTVDKNHIDGLAKLDLPDGASITLFSSRPIEGLKSQRLRRVKLSGGKSAAILEGPAIQVVVDDPAEPSKKAFEPGARARALLRGIEIAEADLADAGGSFDFSEVQRMLRGVSRQRIDRRVQEGSLLAVPGPSNRRRFPALQFDTNGEVVRGLERVQQALAFKSPWSVLNFLANPHSDLGAQRPIELLKQGKLDTVLAAAQRIGMQGA